MEESSLELVKSKVSELALLRAEKNQLKIQSSAVEAKCTEIEEELKERLVAAGLRTFKCDDGSITLVDKASVKVPKTPEQKAQFFAYLRSRNVFDELATVNSQTLNSFYREEERIALERGDISFEIPGLEAPTVYQELRFSGAKA